MMNQNLINSLAKPVNNVADAYTKRTEQLDASRVAADQKRDNDMLKVFEFAGDGRADEAKYYAEANGLQVPPEIYSNADFAKGLTLAGKLYGDDPVAAQKFTQGWMTNQNGDFQTRLSAAQQVAGKPIDPNDREYQRKIAFEIWKQTNLPKDPDVSRFKAGQDAYNKVMESGLSNAAAADAARMDAIKNWDSEYGKSGSSASPGLTRPVNLPAFGTAPEVNNGPLSIRNNNPGNMRPQGQTSGFQQFQNPQEGLQAMRADLAAKVSGTSPAMQARYGVNYNPTLANIIATWAPPEENNTPAYVMHVSRQTGIGPNQTLTQADIDRIIPAMIEMEGGQEASQYFGYGQQQRPVQTATAQQIPSGLPQGSVMIGTANGRPVYQAPSGERFIDDGNP